MAESSGDVRDDFVANEVLTFCSTLGTSVIWDRDNARQLSRVMRGVARGSQ